MNTLKKVFLYCICVLTLHACNTKDQEKQCIIETYVEYTTLFKKIDQKIEEVLENFIKPEKNFNSISKKPVV